MHPPLRSLTLLALSLSLLAPTFAAGPRLAERRLNEVLRLPRLLDEHFGRRKVSEQAQRTPELLAQALMGEMFRNPWWSRALTRRTLLSIPGDPYARLSPSTRLKNYGVRALTGKSSGDRWARAWWELRLNAPAVSTYPEPRRGMRVLTVTRGSAQVKSPLTGGGFGHASMGTLVLGGRPEEDVFMNAGSNPPDDYKPKFYSGIIGNSKINNRIVVSNFWDYAETQNQLRHVALQVEVLQLTEAQAEVVEALMGSADGINYGRFNIIANNCSHGTRDFLNSLLPLDAEIDMMRFAASDFQHPLTALSALTPTVTPPKVMRGAKTSFPLIGAFGITAPTPPRGFKTPAGFSVRAHPNLRALASYRTYENWLRANIR